MQTVTLTFDLAIWFLFATRHLVMMLVRDKLSCHDNYCANLFFKIPLHMTKLLAGHEQVLFKLCTKFKSGL